MVALSLPNCRARHHTLAATHGEKRMSWTKPRVTEVCLALEINCYASATV